MSEFIYIIAFAVLGFIGRFMWSHQQLKKKVNELEANATKERLENEKVKIHSKFNSMSLDDLVASARSIADKLRRK